MQLHGVWYDLVHFECHLEPSACEALPEIVLSGRRY
jgi:hypothetical protein